MCIRDSFYAEGMFDQMDVEKEQYQLKPMNCPFHCLVYKDQLRSYRDLPFRWAELGTVYRYEQSGELHGLTRVRGFTQDDAHIFCTQDQLKEEVSKVIDLVLYIFKTLDFQNFVVQVSLRDPQKPEKYIGEQENWDKAELAIQEVAEEKGLETIVELGEAAFYGPKLDFMVRDAIGRRWQLGTVQIDYNLPDRFELDPCQGRRRPPLHAGPDGPSPVPRILAAAPADDRCGDACRGATQSGGWPRRQARRRGPPAPPPPPVPCRWRRGAGPKDARKESL